MLNITFKVLVAMIAAALLFPLPDGAAFAETLNPDAVNPHAEAPKKRISLERKMAAAEARKKKQAEIAARKSGQPTPPATTNQEATTAVSASDTIEMRK